MGWDVAAKTLGQNEFADWAAFVGAGQGGTVYSLPAYLDALGTASGARFRVIGVRRGDELVGGVALFERDSRFGSFVAPRPLLYYNGVVVRRYDTQYPSENTARHVRILTALEAAIAATGLASVYLRTRDTYDVRPFTIHGWKAQPSYTYVVDLELEKAWLRVEQNLRRLIDRAGKEGLRFSDDDDFDAFFAIHVSTLGRHEAGPYLPRDAFRTFVASLRRQSMARTFFARTPDGRAVAAQLVLLGPNGMSHTVSAGADPEFNRIGASAFLRWKSFEALAAIGCRYNDLTDATLNSVTHFKSQFGGELELSMALTSVQSPRYRLGHGMMRAALGARDRAAGAARAMLRRGRSGE